MRILHNKSNQRYQILTTHCYSYTTNLCYVRISLSTICVISFFLLFDFSNTMLHILTPFILNAGAKVYNKSAVLISVEGFRVFFCWCVCLSQRIRIPTRQIFSGFFCYNPNQFSFVNYQGSIRKIRKGFMPLILIGW